MLCSVWPAILRLFVLYCIVQYYIALYCIVFCIDILSIQQHKKRTTDYDTQKQNNKGTNISLLSFHNSVMEKGSREGTLCFRVERHSN